MVVTKHAVPVEDMSAEDSSVASGTSPLHEWDSGEKIPITKEKKDMKKGIVLSFYGCMIVAGVVMGWFLSRQFRSSSAASNVPNQNTNPTMSAKDTQTFKDSAEGTLDSGGFNGEGTHKLIRDGGPSQTAYLLSSVVDLDQYVGKKVKVFGQTVAAKKASWLMDVGKVEIVK